MKTLLLVLLLLQGIGAVTDAQQTSADLVYKWLTDILDKNQVLKVSKRRGVEVTINRI
jgi:hypothetical protein